MLIAEVYRSTTILAPYSPCSSLNKISFFDLRRLTRLSRSPGQHVLELDGIRGYACLSVVAAHCLINIIAAPENTIIYYIQSHAAPLLVAGVDLFFVLSGFLIGGILLDSRKNPHFFEVFWIRRAARILPVLWILLATYAAALFIRSSFNLPQMDVWLLLKPIPPFWTYFTFTQNIPLALGGYGNPRWVGITWSLAIEEQFYLIFPFAVYLLPRKWIAIIALLGIGIAPICRDVFAHIFGNWFAPYVLLPSRMDGLMFGVLLALMIRNSRSLVIAFKGRKTLDVVALVIIVLELTDTLIGKIWTGLISAHGSLPPLHQSALSLLSAILILRIFLYGSSPMNQIWRSTILTKAGLISYALYMYHQAVNGTVHAYFFNQEPRIETSQQLIAAFAVIIIAISLATISYFLVEKPIRKLGYDFTKRLQRGTVAARNELSVVQANGH
jgi:peptidoglycan/LPS O-acetylase OafA/YrhL